HPSVLPRHRGPVPVAWAIKQGEEEIGITFHRMDADLDTGPVFAQRAIPIGEYAEPEEFYGRIGPIMIEVLHEALARLEAGEPGTPQAGDGEYESFLTEDDTFLDLSRSREDAHRLVWAWRYTVVHGG